MSKYVRDQVLVAAGTALPADDSVTVDVDLWGTEMEIIHAQARVTWGVGADGGDGFKFQAYAIHGEARRRWRMTRWPSSLRRCRRRRLARTRSRSW